MNIGKPVRVYEVRPVAIPAPTGPVPEEQVPQRAVPQRCCCGAAHDGEWTAGVHHQQHLCARVITKVGV